MKEIENMHIDSSDSSDSNDLSSESINEDDY